MIVAFQGFGQLRHTYGAEQAEEITSGPYTRLVLRMASPKEAKYGSELLGLPAEVERLRESKSAHWWKRNEHHNFSTERPMVSPVTAGEIQAAEDGVGWLGQGGKMCRVHLAYRAAKEKQPGFIAREWPAYMPPEKKPKAEPKLAYQSRYSQKVLPGKP